MFNVGDILSYVTWNTKYEVLKVTEYDDFYHIDLGDTNTGTIVKNWYCAKSFAGHINITPKGDSLKFKVELKIASLDRLFKNRYKGK